MRLDGSTVLGHEILGDFRNDAFREMFAQTVAQDAEKLGARHDHQPIELLLTVCIRKTASYLSCETLFFGCLQLVTLINAMPGGSEPVMDPAGDIRAKVTGMESRCLMRKCVYKLKR